MYSFRILSTWRLLFHLILMCVFPLSSWLVRLELYPFYCCLQRTSLCLGLVDFVWEIIVFHFIGIYNYIIFFSLISFIWPDSFLPCFLRRKTIQFEYFLLSNMMTFRSINPHKHCLCIYFCQCIFSFRLVQNLFKLLLKLPLWPFFKTPAICGYPKISCCGWALV